MKSAVQPADLEALAQEFEALPQDRQRQGLIEALHFLRIDQPSSQEGAVDREFEATWVGLLADSGAFESAAIGLLPAESVYTCGRLSDGGYIAQVVLPGGAGAHSRGARSLSMALAAALMRALARQTVERSHRP